MLRVELMSWSGHEAKEWDPNKPGALEEIRAFFEEKLSKGFRAYALKKGETSRLITKFDEEAERIVLTADKVKVVLPVTKG